MSLIADAVVSAATVAFAHFGVTLDVPERPQPQAERTIARTPPPKKPAPVATRSSDDCPEKAGRVQKI
jgi:hypothetical protein